VLWNLVGPKVFASIVGLMNIVARTAHLPENVRQIIAAFVVRTRIVLMDSFALGEKGVCNVQSTNTVRVYPNLFVSITGVRGVVSQEANNLAHKMVFVVPFRSAQTQVYGENVSLQEASQRRNFVMSEIMIVMASLTKISHN
tara:strand:- start:8268 stop:8693 length:426 start_codon:yes stop_codon:yes gene_type:complete